MIWLSTTQTSAEPESVIAVSVAMVAARPQMASRRLTVICTSAWLTILSIFFVTESGDSSRTSVGLRLIDPSRPSRTCSSSACAESFRASATRCSRRTLRASDLRDSSA